MFGFKKIGDVVATTMGNVKITGNPISGGEGNGYEATLNDKKVFLKLYHKGGVANLSEEEAKVHRLKRDEFIISQKLNVYDSAFNAPFALSLNIDNPGYVCEWIEDLTSLGDWLEDEHPYGERLAVVGQLAYLLDKLHKINIAHGDINENNVCVKGSGESTQVILIDFGNFNNGDPNLKPLMTNNPIYISSWQQAGSGHVSDIYADCFAFGMIAYHLLLAKPTYAAATDEESMNAYKNLGKLPGDPLCGTSQGDDIGLPFGILTPMLQTALRGLLAPEHGAQPNMACFLDIFIKEMTNLMSCNSCSMPYYWHLQRKTCPSCHSKVPCTLMLKLPGGIVPIDKNLLIGRDQLNNEYISRKHLVISPAGLGAAKVVITGRNGIQLYRHNGHNEYLTTASQPVIVTTGDTLELNGTKISFVDPN